MAAAKLGVAAKAAAMIREFTVISASIYDERTVTQALINTKSQAR
jgi:hypothetical protein